MSSRKRKSIYETDREYLIVSLMFQDKKQMLKQNIRINATKIDDSLDFALIKDQTAKSITFV